MSSIEEWGLEDISDRNVEVAKNIQKLLKNWINDYDNDTNIPDQEALKIIEEYRRKGWIS